MRTGNNSLKPTSSLLLVSVSLVAAVILSPLLPVDNTTDFEDRMSRVIVAHVEQIAPIDSYTILNTQYGLLLDESERLAANATNPEIKEAADDIVEGCNTILDNFVGSGDKEVFKVGIKLIENGTNELSTDGPIDLSFEQPVIKKPVEETKPVEIPEVYEIDESFDEPSLTDPYWDEVRR